MQFKIGDKVKFLNEVGGGQITSIIDNRTFGVTTEDGFEIPMMKNQIVLDSKNNPLEEAFFNSEKEIKAQNASSKLEKLLEEEENQLKVKSFQVKNSSLKSNANFEASFIEQNEESFEEEDDDNFLKNTDDIDIYAGFVPKDSNLTNANLDFYIINDSNYTLNYIYFKKVDALFEAISGSIEANSKEKILLINRNMINTLDTMYFQLNFYKKNMPFRIREAQKAEIKIHPPKFFMANSYKENDFFDEKAMIFALYEENSMAKALDNLSKSQKESFIEKANPKPEINKGNLAKKQVLEKVEIDLHIEELIENTKGLSPKEMLDIQMDTFRKELNEAIKNHKVEKIIFIHGVGNGRLKSEIRKALDNDYKKLQYQDASYKEYGYGATLVFVK